MKERLSFKSIKEDRSGYFVEYFPADGLSLFATLQIIIISDIELKAIKEIMEKEAEKWINRYPIPIMVTSFDKKEDVIYVNESRKNSHLIAWFNPTNNEIVTHWKLVKNDQIPDDALDLKHLKETYHDLPYQTSQQIKDKADKNFKKHIRQNRFSIFVLLLWLTVIPATIAIWGWLNPVVSFIALIYSLYKAFEQGSKLMGWKNTSKKELEKMEEEKLMKHHHYHCKINPEGFQRLVAENFEKEAIARTINEKKNLKT
jgi:hypothetical protein